MTPYPPSTAPTLLLPYLTSTGSLTYALESLARQRLRVVVVFEGFRLLTLTERTNLAHLLPSRTKPVMAWVREVALYGNNKDSQGNNNPKEAWVSATSFLITPLTGKAHRLRHLGTTPMGYVLFKTQKTLPKHRTFSPDGMARQTIYDWRGTKVVVVERFLGAFLDKLENLTDSNKA